MNPHFSYISCSTFKNIRKSISIVIIAAFIGTSIKTPVYAQALNDSQIPWMPKPGTRLTLSPEFTPAYLKGLVIHPDNALQFDFIINRGDLPLSSEEKQTEYKKLIKYFLASLAVPDENQWVNLSPYEKDRIIKDDFGKTEMGRDLLAQDYILKQITASLIYPESNLGQKFWDRVYTQAQQQYGTSNIPVNTFNKVWIVPDEAYIYEHGNSVYVVKQHLKVMLEQDYLSLSKHSGITHVPTPQGADVSKLGSQIVKEIVLPELEKEVNQGKNFAMLRQVYSGMLLAAWYKRTLKESLLGKIYADRDKVKGVDQDPKTNEEIYQQYLKAFKKGVFNYIKEDVDKYTNEAIPRKYFSGGTEGYKDYAQIVRKADPAEVNADLANSGSQLDDVVADLKGDKEPVSAVKLPVRVINNKRNEGPVKIQFDNSMNSVNGSIPGVLTTTYQKASSDVTTNARALADILDQAPFDTTLKATRAYEKVSGRTYGNRDFYQGDSDLDNLKFKDQYDGSSVETVSSVLNGLGLPSFASRQRGVIGYEITSFSAREKVYSIKKTPFYNLRIVIQPSKSVPHVDDGRNAGVWLTLRELTQDQIDEFLKIVQQTPEALAYYFKTSNRPAFQRIYDGFIEPGLSAGFYNLGNLDADTDLRGVNFDKLYGDASRLQTIKGERNTEVTHVSNRHFYTMELKIPIIEQTQGGRIRKVTLKGIPLTADTQSKVQVNSFPVGEVNRSSGDVDITQAVLETMDETNSDHVNKITVSFPDTPYLTSVNVVVQRDQAMVSKDVKDYVNGLRTGDQVFRMNLTGAEVKGLLGFDDTFPAFYDALKQKVLDVMAAGKPFTQQDIYNEALALIQHLENKDNAMESSQRKKILVIDDDSAVSITVKTILTRKFPGYQVVVAPSGEEAISQFKPNEFAAIISDTNLPGTTGYDVVAQLQSQDPDVKVVAMSGDTTDRNIQGWRDLSAKNGKEIPVLAKPFALTTLVETIKSQVDQAQLSDRKKILIIDDEPDMRELMTDMLGVYLSGYQVIAAASGQEALDQFKPGEFALILSDTNLKNNETGYGVVRQLKAIDPTVNVVAMTGLQTPENINGWKGLSTEVGKEIPLLSKPFFDFQKLSDTLRAQMDAAMLTVDRSKERLEMSRKFPELTTVKYNEWRPTNYPPGVVPHLNSHQALLDKLVASSAISPQEEKILRLFIEGHDMGYSLDFNDEGYREDLINAWSVIGETAGLSSEEARARAEKTYQLMRDYTTASPEFLNQQIENLANKYYEDQKPEEKNMDKARQQAVSTIGLSKYMVPKVIGHGTSSIVLVKRKLMQTGLDENSALGLALIFASHHLGYPISMVNQFVVGGVIPPELVPILLINGPDNNPDKLRLQIADKGAELMGIPKAEGRRIAALGYALDRTTPARRERNLTLNNLRIEDRKPVGEFSWTGGETSKKYPLIVTNIKTREGLTIPNVFSLTISNVRKEADAAKGTLTFFKDSTPEDQQSFADLTDIFTAQTNYEIARTEQVQNRILDLIAPEGRLGQKGFSPRLLDILQDIQITLDEYTHMDANDADWDATGYLLGFLLTISRNPTAMDHIRRVGTNQEEVSKIVEGLRKSMLGQYFDISNIQTVAFALGTGIKVYNQGEDVIRQGDTSATDVYVILDGKVDITVDGKLVASRGEGEILGEMAVVNHVPRTATVTVTSPTATMIRIPADVFVNTTKQNETFSQELQTIIKERFAEQSKVLSEQGQNRTVKDEAMKGGIDLNAANLNLQIKRDGNGVPLPISQQDLEHMNIDGLVPVIMEIKPATTLPIFSQLNVPSSSANG